MTASKLVQVTHTGCLGGGTRCTRHLWAVAIGFAGESHGRCGGVFHAHYQKALHGSVLLPKYKACPASCQFFPLPFAPHHIHTERGSPLSGDHTEAPASISNSKGLACPKLILSQVKVPAPLTGGLEYALPGSLSPSRPFYSQPHLANP